MKRLLLLFAASCLFISCEDNATDVVPQAQVPVPIKILTAKINGANILFDDTTVEKRDEVTTEGVPYTDLYVTAKKKNDTSAKIVFKLQYMRTGGETCYYFLYHVGDREYDIETDNSFQINITHGEANKIKGNFNGTLTDFEGNSITITNGNFDIAF